MSDKAIFLDRDDTLIEDPGYISDPEQVKILEGVPEALIQLKSLGYKLIVVSNQSGVARGIVTEKKLEEMVIDATEDITSYSSLNGVSAISLVIRKQF